MSNISPIIKANATSVLTLKQQIKSLTETLNQQSETLVKQMQENGLNQIIIEDVGVVNLKDMQERLVVDNNRLKNVYNQIYQDCIKVSQVKAHLEYRLNK